MDYPPGPIDAAGQFGIADLFSISRMLIHEGITAISIIQIGPASEGQSLLIPKELVDSQRKIIKGQRRLIDFSGGQDGREAPTRNRSRPG